MALSTNVLLRTDKRNVRGEHPIIITVCVKNQLKKISTGISILKFLWDSQKKQALYLSRKDAKQIKPETDYNSLPSLEEVNEINRSIQKIIHELENAAKLFELEKQPYSAEMIVTRYKSIKTPIAWGFCRKWPPFFTSKWPPLTLQNGHLISLKSDHLTDFKGF